MRKLTVKQLKALEAGRCKINNERQRKSQDKKQSSPVIYEKDGKLFRKF